MSTMWGVNQSEGVAPAIADTINDFILSNPEWIIYLRKDQRFRCIKHWDFKTGTLVDLKPGEICTDCYGFGYKITPMVVPCRFTRSPAKSTGRTGDMRLEGGYTQYYHQQIDFPKEIKPELEDIVLTCEFKAQSTAIGDLNYCGVLRVINGFLIKQVNANYEREISWFSCGVEVFNSRQTTLSNLPKVLTSVPVLNFDYFNTPAGVCDGLPTVYVPVPVQVTNWEWFPFGWFDHSDPTGVVTRYYGKGWFSI